MVRVYEFDQEKRAEAELAGSKIPVRSSVPPTCPVL